MDTQLLTFIVSIAGTLIVLLLGIVAWMIKKFVDRLDSVISIHGEKLEEHGNRITKLEVKCEEL